MQAPSPVLAALAFYLALSIAYPQTSPSSINLFPVDKSCVCVRTRHWTATVDSRERIVRGNIFQVFLSRPSKQELFRIPFGRIQKGKHVTYWNYGIAREGDWNADGLTDYSWYGGDDNSEELILALSSPQGYLLVDTNHSAATLWPAWFQEPRPDLYSLNSPWRLEKIRLVTGGAELAVTAVAVANFPNKTKSRPIRIPQSSFLPPPATTSTPTP